MDREPTIRALHAYMDAVANGESEDVIMEKITKFQALLEIWESAQFDKQIATLLSHYFPSTE